MKYRVWINSDQEWEKSKRIYKDFDRKELIEFSRSTFEKFISKNPDRKSFYYKGHLMLTEEFKLTEI